MEKEKRDSLKAWIYTALAGIAVILFICAIIAIPMCYGDTGIFYGHESPISKFSSEDYNYQGAGVIVSDEMVMYEDWSLDRDIALWIHEADDVFNFTFGIELYVSKDVGRSLSLRAGGGVSCLAPSSNHPEWADSMLLGTFGGGVRFLKNYEIRFTHFSVPFNDNDKGRNLLMFVLWF